MRKFFPDRTPPTSEQIAETYDAQASTWLRRAGRAETWLTSPQWRDDMVHSLEGDVLEIGVGAGDTLIRVAKYDHAITSFTGIDLSAGMVEQATLAAAGLEFPVDFRVQNAEDLSNFPDNSFDTVTASLVFCTIADVPLALAEIARVLRPNGKALFIEHVLSPNRLVAGLQRLFAPGQIRLIGCHIDRTTIQTIQQHGYEIDEHRQRLFGVIRFVVARPPV